MAKYHFVIDGKDFRVDVGARTSDQVRVTVNGKQHVVELRSGPGTQQAAATSPSGAMGRSSRSAAAGGGDGEVRAPMAGMVLSIAVQEGQVVSTGDELLVLEAMKMENKINASHNGVVDRVSVQLRQNVNRGDLLLTLSRLD